jgi:DNA-binding NtrC family response regulator
VFLTAEGTKDNLTAAICLGACDFIVKPIDADILRKKMASNLKHFMIRRRLRDMPAIGGSVH